MPLASNGVLARDAAALPASVTVREAVFSDYDQIRPLILRYELEAKTFEAWKDLWSGNPVYECERTWPIGWVLEAGGRVVGYLGNIPLWYRFRARTLIVAAGYSWVVDAGYRSYALLLMDHYFSQKCADLFLSTTVNVHAANAFSTFECLRAPVGSWDRSLFWITNYRGFAASWAALKGVPGSRALGYILMAPLWLKDRRARTALRKVRDRTAVQWCSRFDERFDVFWEALSQQRAEGLLAVRTREILQWHFRHALDENKVWILTVTDQSNLAAYAIFLRQGNPKYGLERLRLIDFQALDGHLNSLAPMVAHALRQCRAEKVDMLEYIGVNAESEEALERLSPLHRTLPSWLYYYKAPDDALARELADTKAWNPTSFDGDSSL